MSGVNPRHPGDSEASYRDRTAVAARGRGSSTLNPGNRFEPVRLHVLGEYLDEQQQEHPDGRQIATRVFHDRTRTIINRVADSPDIPFRWTINPYRGCEHGCIYCYARPGHEYLGMSCGLDFESKIMAKLDAAELLKRELAKRSWTGEPIVMSGVTDCYQPLEEKLRLTRQCLEVMAECRQPASIVTKNRLVLRDLDILTELARHRAIHVALSVTTLDPKLARVMEPRTSVPRDRLKAIEQLAAAGVPVSVMTAPIIPGLNDRELPELLKAAKDHGAQHAGWVMLRLPHQIKALFLEWLHRHFPDRAARVESLIRQSRGGDLYDTDFSQRMRGSGRHAETIRDMFRLWCRKLGLDRPMPKLSSDQFRRPSRDGQQGLFDGIADSPDE
ncbi:MAG: PA0069 family radical SAM protein [Phycisphaerales bacterium]|nr:MAG: PA0069 family radical SAM protein [Phycisphaerales bacterium]